MSTESEENNELEIILNKFKQNELFNLNLEILNENELIKKYYEIKELKFNFMESIILNLINKSLINSNIEKLFKEFDNLLSNLLIKVKDDNKLLNGFKCDNNSNNIINNTQFDNIQIIDNKQVNNNFNNVHNEDNQIETTDKENEIILSSDDDSTVNYVDLIPIDESNNNYQDFNIIDELNESNEQFDYQKYYVNSSHKPEFLRRDYEFSQKLFSTFYNVFGLKKFRKNQLEIINAILLDNDVFVLMPTGSGKSICFQLPAILKNGVTIVISPLRSLIQDQVQKLKLLDIKAETLCNHIRTSSEKEIYDDLKSDAPTIKLLYLTPEKISQSKRLIKALEILYEKDLITRFVIDEVHCVSSWGHDFRPDYKKLSLLREKFNSVPIMCLTATATPRVSCDIMTQLRLKKPVCVIQSFNRCNLRFEVREKTKETLDEIIDMIKTKFYRKSGILYCLSRYECEEISETLCKNGIKARPYHAGISDKDRFTIQENWLIDRFNVICATIAFGMGIDKPDVRFVIHYSSPKSLEGYYQEAGRAGRDNGISYCYLYYSYKDIKRLFKLFEDKSGNRWDVHINCLNSVAYYCTNNLQCRRLQLLNYFGEKFNVEECSKQTVSCDVCESNVVYELQDFTEQAKLIVESIDRIYKNENKQFPIQHYVDIYKGSMNAKIKSENHNLLPMHGKGKKFDKEFMDRLFRKLILEDLIRESVHLTGQFDVVVAYLAPTKKGKGLLNDRIKFEIPVLLQDDVNKSAKKNKPKQSDNQIKDDFKEKNLSRFEDYCYRLLLDESNKYAKENELNQCTIIPLNSLKDMAIRLPENKKEMLQIPHVNKIWFEKYGIEFLKIIQQCLKLKKDTEQLNNDVTLDSSLIEIMDDESEQPCTSSSIICDNNLEHKNKKLKR